MQLGPAQQASTMGVSGKQKRHLRGLAHSRKPVVAVGGKGLSDAVVHEIDQALGHHELLKIKLPPLDKTERHQMLQSICGATDSELIQIIGHTAVLFRAADPSRIELPAP